MTLYRSVTAAWLWIVHAATIPAVQSVCKRWFDDSIQTAECLHRTWQCYPMRACVRRSGLNVVLQWKCVFMLSWCCVSVVTGQVLWDCARNVSSPSFPIVCLSHVNSLYFHHTAYRRRKSHAAVYVLVDSSERGARGQSERLRPGEAQDVPGPNPRSGEREGESSSSSPSSSPLPAAKRQEAQIAGSSHQRGAATACRWARFSSLIHSFTLFSTSMWKKIMNIIEHKNLLSSEKRTLDHWATVQFFSELLFFC